MMFSLSFTGTSVSYPPRGKISSSKADLQESNLECLIHISRSNPLAREERLRILHLRKIYSTEGRY